ncbi:hypothetical protein AB0M28_38110 [Streptomyces sp. NPDC051940]|uniref:hypothetical protein n=1 Tax=Streptomyces sp. NPDC051940 TaxID=3155675 RepID=UPI00344205F9
MIAVCARCEDFERTIRLMNDLALYAVLPGADAEFTDTAAYALAASLPFDAPPVIGDGPDEPGAG